MVKMKELQIEKINLEKEGYKTCDKCCYDILDDEGDVMDHECLEEVSNCCTSPVYPESDICIRCGEHCEIILI